MWGLPWWLWVIASGLLALAELHAPGSYLIWIALGAAVTGIAAAWFGVGLSAQVGVFAAASALSCLAGYFVYRRYSRRRRQDPVLNDRAQAALGGRGVVCERFAHGQGKIRLGDGVWLASGPDLAEGTAVVVVSVNGTRLTVEPIGEPMAAAVHRSAAI